MKRYSERDLRATTEWEGGKLFTNLFLALKQWGDVGIAVSLGKRYSNICIIQDDDKRRNLFAFVESRVIFFYKNL